MLKESIQARFNQVHDEKLKELAGILPDVLVESKAKTTQNTYKRGFELWSRWASNFKEVKILPASALYVALFFVSLIQDGVSCGIINEIHYGLKWVHELSGFQDPCQYSIVKTVLEASKRLLSIRVKKKEPITPEIIKSLFNKYGLPSANLSDLRLLNLCVLGYTGFLRFNELVGLRRCDFEFESTFMRIFIERSKTDVYRDGAWVVIAQTYKPTCPVKLCMRFFELAGFEPNSDEYIFRSLTFYSSQGIYKFRNPTPLSYSRSREIVLEALEKIGLPKEEYGLHSFRAGGASAAANANISDRLFKRHGRWKSEKAKDGYIKDNIESLLSVSKSLGI